MVTYAPEVEARMKAFFDSLSEKDRRRYAAVEVAKLGHGGLDYVSHVLGCHPQTIQQGSEDVEALPADEAEGRIRKKGRSKES